MSRKDISYFPYQAFVEDWVFRKIVQKSEDVIELQSTLKRENQS